ncbi:sister chromatid cohesion protein 1 [Rhizophlyctis rosea]|nr:sister chromatid cohesion protein 1 [Rhizophlyctis rosea]
MFYSENILLKKGALAKVWLAAHWERKLSKTQTLQTNIEGAVGQIVRDGQQPLALRLTGQLLLGVVKIYSRKARYLLEDCNEALMKIKMAFRPGDVNMPTEHAIANANAITLPDAMTELDILLPEPSFDLRSFLAQSTEQALSGSLRSQDTTLSSEQGSFLLEQEQEEPLRDIFGIQDSQEEEGGAWSLNLGLDEPGPSGLDQPSAEDSMEIEVGRDAAGARPFSPGTRDSMSMTDEPSFATDKRLSLDLGVGDLGLGMEQEDPSLGPPGGDDIGLNLDKPLDFMDLDRQHEEGDQPLDLPELPGDIGNESFQVPDDIQANPTGAEAPDVDNDNGPQQQAQRQREERKQKASRKRRLVDEETELSTEFMKKQIEDTSDITEEQRFVPASRKLQKLMDIRKQGAAYFFSVDRLDVPKQFRHLLEFRPRRRHRQRAQEVPEQEEPSPRKRKAAEVQERRESEDFIDQAGPSGLNFEEEFQAAGDFALPESFDTTGEPLEAQREGEEGEGEMQEVPLQKKRRTDGEDVPEEEREEGTGSPSLLFEPEEESQDQPDDSGFSRSTVRTVKTLQTRFDAQDGEEKELSFEEMTTKAKRTDAVKLFFELLVLKTRDMVHVEQEEAYGDIKITPKVSCLGAILVAAILRNG